MSRFAIEGARIIDPASGRDSIGSLYVAEGIIVGIDTPPADFSAEKTVAGQGLVLIPGLVDLAARGMERRSELEAAVAGGVTTVCCPPDTQPPLDEPGLVDALCRHAEQAGLARLLPLGALTVGLQGDTLAELNALSRAGCVAFSQGLHPIANLRSLRRALQYAATFDLPVWLQPEDPALANDGVAHEGEVASRLGLPGVPATAETIAIFTRLALARETGARLHLTRLSTAEGVALVRRARFEGIAVTCDVAVHALHFTEHDIGFFDTHARLAPPLRTALDRDALIAGVADGTISAICSDHTPVSADGKALPFAEAKPGATAVELLLPLTLEWSRQTRQGWATALAAVTSRPADIAGTDAGRLTIGARADLCLFDPDAEWSVTPATLRSRGKNTLALGRTLRGKVRQTYVGGKLAYSAA